MTRVPEPGTPPSQQPERAHPDPAARADPHVDDRVRGRWVERLLGAPLEVVGQFSDASNTTLLVRLGDGDPRSLDALAADAGRALTLEDLDPADLAVYKPARGEAPLHDFPAGTLHRREVAAFLVSEVLGWGLVPETVLRVDAPLGVGSVQRFVPHDPGIHYFTLIERADPGLESSLQAMTAFDVVINNADRKAGHVLYEAGSQHAGVIRCIDHGVSFHAQPKLRTVAWDFIGEAVAGARLADVDRLCERLTGEFGARLGQYLAPEEVAALRARGVALLAAGVLPAPYGPRPTPWPLL